MIEFEVLIVYVLFVRFWLFLGIWDFLCQNLQIDSLKVGLGICLMGLRQLLYFL